MTNQPDVTVAVHIIIAGSIGVTGSGRPAGHNLTASARAAGCPAGFPAPATGTEVTR